MRLLGFLRVSKDCGFAHKRGCLLEKRENKRGVGLLGNLFFFLGGGFYLILFCFWGELTSPQHMPTMRNPITQRHIGGEGGGVVGEESGSIFVDMDE